MAHLTKPELEALSARAYQAMRRYPNVHAVAIGNRMRGGRTVKELVLAVFVSRKLGQSDLAPDDIIPSEFEGIPTDVVEMGQPKLLLELGEVPGVESANSDSTKHRPLKGGMQISGSPLTSPRGQGTMGFFVREKGKDPRQGMGVTNWHVLFDKDHPHGTDTNARVGNPSANADDSGSFGAVVASDYSGSSSADPNIPDLLPRTDSALIGLDPNTEWVAEIQCIGNITGFHSLTNEEGQSQAYKVRKYGRTTRLTGGTIMYAPYVGTAKGKNVPDRIYHNGLAIMPNSSLADQAVMFADEGDSGSAIVNAANEIVGVLFAAQVEKGESLWGWGVAFPITALIDKYKEKGIELIVATATKLNDIQRTPAAAATKLEAAVVDEIALARQLEAELLLSEKGRG